MDSKTSKATKLSELENLLQRIRQKAWDKTRHADFAEYELDTVELSHRVGSILLELELAKHDPEERVVTVDGVPHTRVAEGIGRYMSILGPIAVARGRYRAQRNAPTVCPLELEVGVVDGFWTPQAAKVAALAVTDLTPGRAETLFSEMRTLSASKSSFDRLPKAVGERWEANRVGYESALLSDETIPENAAVVAVSIDGVMLTMNDERERDQKKTARRARGRRDSGPLGQREASVGSISFYDCEGTRLITRRYGRMPEARKKTLKQQLLAELRHISERRPDLFIIAVADGSRGLWNWLETLNPDAQVVDFYHAVDRLKDTLDELMGATSRDTHEEFERLRTVLLDESYGVESLIGRLEQLARDPRRTRRRSIRGPQYFLRHRTRMDYAGFQAANLPIGSGVIEGTAKSLVSDRFKRAGMRWSRSGGQAILTLRALAQSDRFDRAWEMLAATYRRRVGRAAAA